MHNGDRYFDDAFDRTRAGKRKPQTKVFATETL